MKIPFKAYWNLLAKYLKPHLGKVVALGIALISSVGLQLINPQIVRFFIDSAVKQKPTTVLLKAAILFFCLAFVQQLLSLLTTYLGKHIGWVATNALRKDLVAHCLSLDMSFHKSLKAGELIERVDGDVSILLNFFSQLSIVIINNIILIIGVLLLLYREDWRIGLAQTIFVLITGFALVRAQNLAVPHWKAVRATSADFYGFVGEQISSTEDIKASGAISYTMKNFFEHIQKWYPKQKKATKLGYSMYLLYLALVATGNCIAFGMGAYLWKRGVITIGTIYLFYNYTSYIVAPMDQIRRQLQDLQKAGASISRVEELFTRESLIKDGTGPDLKDNNLEIAFDKVNFQYEQDVTVLRNLSFKLPQGKILGILGRTGSGKTTLARLMMRFYDTTEGDIYINNRSIKSIPLKNLREKVAYVTQDVQLFNATVRDNITLFNKSIKDEAILDIIKKMGIMPWYEALPKGLDTMLGANGTGLSAGESQLLAFIRVFLKDPKVVILDEASSRLDPATEKLIQNAILKLLEGRSGIIIAHRLWTVQCADEILILDQGKILEHNSRSLLEKDTNSNFHKLLNMGLEEVLA